jgi:hypothetical protein
LALRSAVAIVFLLLQVASLIYARFTPRRYFAWAPNDYVVEYTLEVKVNGRALTSEEASARYRIPRERASEFEYPVEHLIDNISQYETTYAGDEPAEVRLTWKYNGHPELRKWQWPQ